MTSLILASGSKIRASILDQAGITYQVERPDVDEAKIKEECAAAGEDLVTTAQILADQKALKVAKNTQNDDFILASDQILEFQGRGFDKPQSMAEAKTRLQEIQGETHTLINAVTIAQNKKIVFRHIDRPMLHLRMMTDLEIDTYLREAGEDILSSVGAYQVEKLGARLFDRIEGDYFAVLGLSIFPVLAFLRDHQVIEF